MLHATFLGAEFLLDQWKCCTVSKNSIIYRFGGNIVKYDGNIQLALIMPPLEGQRSISKTLIDIRLRPGIATPLSLYGPLRPNVTSSIKPEVHNVSQRRQRSTEPRPQGICAKKFVEIGPAVPEICSWTDRQTDRQMDWSQYSAPLPGKSNNFQIYVSGTVFV